MPCKEDLYQTVAPPEHMAYLWWGWSRALQKRGFSEMELAFTIHDDVGDFSKANGLYLMLSYGWVSDNAFYLGLQSNTHPGTTPVIRKGRAVIFSQWGTRDLEWARWPEDDGWAESSGHEGDFIGVRRFYDWGPGDYVVRLAPDGADQHGEWLGLWIAESSTGATTWIGSLRFPRVKGEARIAGPVYSTVEIYGDGAIRPIDIPTWHVASSGPGATDIRPSGVRRTTRYSARPS